MSDNIDDWLQSLGLDDPTTQTTVAVPQTTPIIADEGPTPSSEPISTEDFNAILEDNGFQEESEPTFDEAEEVTDEDEDEEWEDEENTDEYDENGDEGRDLDAEEDADWEERIASGLISAVTQPMEVEYHEGVGIVDRNTGTIVMDQEVIDRQAAEGVPNIRVDSPQEEGESLINNESSGFFNNEDTNLIINETETFLNNQTPASAPEPLIPLNSPTLLLNNATSRFSGTEWYNEIQRKRIILAGCGGIGSWTILQLARMNPSALFMYDDDVVEVANMSGQLYCQEDVGKAKVDAMADMIRSYTTMRNIFAIKDKYTNTSEAGDIMICGFDSMEARKTFFGKWILHVNKLAADGEDTSRCIFLDGRLSIDTLQVFCITGDNAWACEEYQKYYLFTDAQADATQCSLKQTTYLACMIGSVIVNLFTNWVANSLNPVIPFDLPFFTEYDAQNMIFKTVK